MIGALIGAGLSAAGSIFGAIKSGKAARREKKMTEQALRDNQAWFDRRYNEDATQRADAQRLITMTNDHIRRRNQAAAGRAAVVGGTDEVVAATAEAGARQMADVVSGINANTEAQKSNIERQYLTRKEALNDRLRGIQAQRSQNIANATTGLLHTAASIGSSIDSLKDAQLERENQLKIAEALNSAV